MVEATIPINDDIGDPLLTAMILSDLRYNTRLNVARMHSGNSSFGGHGFGGGGFSGGGHGGGGGRGL